MALGSQPYQPFGSDFDLITVHYADWLIATPLLLFDLGKLAGMPFSECFFICFLDALMILSGFFAHNSTDYRAAWPLFAFGCFCEALIWGFLLMHLIAIRKEHSQSAESKTFTFLAIWTIFLWSAYPILFILSYTHSMDIDTEVCIYMVLDFLAKGVFGMIIVGSRECLEGEFTPLSMFAMGLVGIQPVTKVGGLRRRNSMDLTLIEEAQMTMHRGDIPSTPTTKINSTVRRLAPQPAQQESDGENTDGDEEVTSIPVPPRLVVREPPKGNIVNRSGTTTMNPLPSVNIFENNDALTQALLAALQSPTVAAKLAAALSPTASAVKPPSRVPSRSPTPDADSMATYTTASRRASLGSSPGLGTVTAGAPPPPPPLGGLLSSNYFGSTFASS